MRSSRAEDGTAGNDSGGRIRRVRVHDGWAPYYRFPLAFHQSCLPVCRSAAARWRSTQRVPARLGRNLFASGRAFAAEEPGAARFATSGVEISWRGLRIATWKAGSQPGPDPVNTAPQPGKSGLFPISGWCLACRTSRTARLDRTAREPRTALPGRPFTAKSSRTVTGPLPHFVFIASGKYSSGSVWRDARFRADNSGAFVDSK